MSVAQREKVDSIVLNGLKGTEFEPAEVQKLDGGNVNWGYRVTLKTPLSDGATEVFVKHGEKFLAKIPDFEVGLDRCRIEAETLGCMTKQPVSGQTSGANSHRFIVRTPNLLHFSRETTTQVHELLPKSVTLKAYILERYFASTPQTHEHECRQLGRAMGIWLNEFNRYSASNSELKRCATENLEATKIRHQFSYGWLPDRIVEYPGILSEAKDILERLLKMATEELEDKSTLQAVHGDLAPANIVLPDLPFEQDRETTVFMIDWEVIHLSRRTFDVGQMTAELYLLWLSKGITAGLWMMEGLLSEFEVEDEIMSFRIAMHMGSYLICMAPLTPEWGTPEELENLMRIGRDMIVHAWNKDKAWFVENKLSCLFK